MIESRVLQEITRIRARIPAPELERMKQVAESAISGDSTPSEEVVDRKKNIRTCMKLMQLQPDNVALRRVIAAFVAELH